jgi:flagellar capping protein FliD
MTGTYAGSDAGTYVISDDGAGNLTAVFTPTNGAPPTTQTAVVTAGGTNASLIPGITLTVGALQAGTQTINVTPSSQSVLRRLKDFVDLEAGAGGVLQKRQDALTTTTKDIADRRQVLSDRIDAEMANLRRKFAAMEQAQARAQSIQQALTQTLSRLNPQG